MQDEVVINPDKDQKINKLAFELQKMQNRFLNAEQELQEGKEIEQYQNSMVEKLEYKLKEQKTRQIQVVEKLEKQLERSEFEVA